jgi:hypothetical protein
MRFCACDNNMLSTGLTSYFSLNLDLLCVTDHLSVLYVPNHTTGIYVWNRPSRFACDWSRILRYAEIVQDASFTASTTGRVLRN